MLVQTLREFDFTLFYFDKHGSYEDLLTAIDAYITTGTTSRELFYFGKDAQFITPDQVKRIVHVAQKAAKVRAPGGKTALLYGRVSLYGLGRLYAVVENRIVDKNWETQVFKDYPAACSWLDVSPEMIETLISANNQVGDSGFTYVEA